MCLVRVGCTANKEMTEMELETDSRDDIGHKVTWLVVGAVGAVVAAMLLTSVVAAHDDGSAEIGATGPELDSEVLYGRLWEDAPNPCAEVLKFVWTGQESGDLRELGMFASVSGLPPIHSLRFQRCTGNRTGEVVDVALSFLINDDLTLVISNSDPQRDSLLDDLDLTTQPTALTNDARPGLHVRSSIYRNDPVGNSSLAVTGSSSFNLNDLPRDGR